VLIGHGGGCRHPSEQLDSSGPGRVDRRRALAGKAGEKRGMTYHDEAVAADRLRQALLVFETARDLHLGAHRRLKALPPTEVEAFWNGPGRRVGETMQAAATEVVAAFETLPGACCSITDRNEILRHIVPADGSCAPYVALICSGL
jgi:hypothetical protein